MKNIDSINNVAVIGSGIMGSGIAQVALLGGYQKVTLNDVNEEILNKARSAILGGLQSLDTEEKFNELIINDMVMQNVMKKSSFKDLRSSVKSVGILAKNYTIDEIMNRLVCEVDLKKSVSDSDFIIEALPENLDLKLEVFKQLSNYSPPHAILASNTSTMSPTILGSVTDRSENVIGMHFHGSFPMKGILIEITGGEKTTEETIQFGCRVAGSLPSIAGERFILRLEKETPGFVANRLTLARAVQLNWILDQAIERGITIDQLLAGGLNLIGLDIVGLDTIYYTWKYLEEYLHSDFAPGEVITELFKNGNLGRKTGKGFFDWDENGPIIKEVMVDDKTKDFIKENRNRELAMAIRMNEGCRLIEDGVIKGYDIINRVDSEADHRRVNTFELGKEKYKEWSEILETTAQRLGKSYLKPCNLMKSGNFLNYP
ncbi:MAG: 3-hydroxyacyl-CoA dehydrogenase family protein [Promethearchaeota archaeon]|jgi:enoyl-CoA hydratase/3-hydroxyacyl-CoA dehydrogenase